MPEKKKIEDLSLKLIRHTLGSVDIDDLSEEKDMSETERKAYCDAIFAVWPRLEKDLKKALHTQLMFISNNAEDWSQVIFGRGTFNGIDLLFEKWHKAVLEHEANTKENKEEFNKSNPISEI